MNAPLGNFNHMTTGLRTVEDNSNRNGVRYALPSCRLPKDERGIDNRCDGFRVELEDATAAVHEGVSIFHANLISAAIDHERGRQLLSWRLRKLEDAGDKVPLAVLSQVVTAIGRCAEGRLRCIRLLDLDKANGNTPWLPALPEPQTAEEAPQSIPTAGDDTSHTPDPAKTPSEALGPLMEESEQ